MDGAFDLITEYAADGFALQPLADPAAPGAFDLTAWIASIRTDRVAAPRVNPQPAPQQSVAQQSEPQQPAPRKPGLTLVADAAATRRARAIAEWDEDLAAERAVTSLRAALRAYPHAGTDMTPPAPRAAVQVIPSLLPACAAGTRVDTADGPVAIEQIAIGDLVMTRDHGLQPVTITNSSTVAASGPNRPVVIAAGAFGDHGTITVSQQCPVMLADWRADLLFGSDEVLLRARDMLNDTTIRLATGGSVETLYHLGFARPELIMAEGLFIASGQSTQPDAATPRMLLNGAEARVMAGYRL